PKRSAPRARTRRCAASAARSMPSPCRAFTRPASPPWRSASRARCCVISQRLRPARRRAASHGWPTARWCRPTWRARRRGSARAYLIETLTTIYAHADDLAPIEVADRARVRLACTNAIHGAAEVVDFAYKAAGVDAIFPGSPFERRFRDMHTLSQQIQAR